MQSIARSGWRRVRTEITGQITQMYAINTEWLTASEAADYLRIKPRTLLLWVRQGRIRGYALSGLKRRVWRFRKPDLDASLFNHDAAMVCCNSPFVLVMKGEAK